MPGVGAACPAMRASLLSMLPPRCGVASRGTTGQVASRPQHCQLTHATCLAAPHCARSVSWSLNSTILCLSKFIPGKSSPSKGKKVSLRSPPSTAGWGAGGGEGAFLTLHRQGKLFKWHLELGLVSELCYPHLQSQHVTATAFSPASFRLTPAVKAA